MNNTNNTDTGLTPSKFTVLPMGSVCQKSEAETIAANIMVILKRTGDTFRKLSWEEYKEERLKDGEFSSGEASYFDRVIDYCTDAKSASLFSPVWKGVYDKILASTPSPTAAIEGIKEEGKGWTKGQWYINQNYHIWGSDCKIADCSNNIQSTVYRLKSVQEMEANAQRIVMAVNGWDELNFKLKAKEAVYDVCAKNNEELKATNNALVSALKEILRFGSALDKGSEALLTPDNFLKAIEEAKELLNNLKS